MIEYSCYVVAIERIPEVDTTIGTIIVVAIVALIVIALIIRFRQRLGFDWRLPFGINLKAEGSNDNIQPAVGIRATKIVSREGGVVADDATGRGVDATDINAKDDVLLSSKPAPTNDPKSPPPT
jgi:hypothetical protein